MVTTDTAFLTIAEAAGLIARREVSPVELTQGMLDRISAIDGQLHSYITVTPEVALSQAQEAEREIAAGTNRGPLHGIPIALKDLYETKGILTTGHSNVLRTNVPARDSTPTALLAKAGSVLLGKLSMHEFATGAPGADSAFPPARNPWNLEYMPGGSSSGSGAALAAGLCYGSLGSDTGGSIRGPASFCGIVGLKPTYGRISRHGVLALSWSLDHAGPMTRTVEDCALMLQAIAGYDPRDPASGSVPVPDYSAALKSGVQGLKIGVPRAWMAEGEGTEPETVAAFEAALKVFEGLGAQVIEVDSKPFIDARFPNSLIILAEAYAYHEVNLAKQPENYGKATRDRVREGALISAADYIQSQRSRTAIRAQIEEILKKVDVIASPAMPEAATKFVNQDAESRYRRPSYTNPANLTGQPAISIPAGFTSDGRPIGLQIAGRPYDEATVLRASYAYEAATPWKDRHPAI